MSHDEIDRILSREGEILPSSGFTASVMEAVRHEASLPPPIPFPWKRALPGIVVAGLVLVAVAWVFVAGILQLLKTGTTAPASSWRVVSQAPIFGATSSPVLWTSAALLLTLASVMLSWRLASGGR